MTRIGFLLILLFPMALAGQNIMVMPELEGSYLTINQKLPKDLLASRTMVMVNTGSAQLVDGSWKTLCKEMHQYLVKTKVDPMLYFYSGDLMAGRDATQNFIEYLLSRDIQNLILLDYYPNSTKEDITFTLTSFNQKKSLVENGQDAWVRKGNNIREIIGALANDIIRAELPLNNFLIPDQPEYIEDITVLTKRRFPVYTTDIRIEKLAVPYFDSILVKSPSNLPAQVLAEINAYNAQVGRNNRELEQIMMGYPYKYALMKYSEDSRFYFSNGFQFVLMHLHARGSTLRRMLDYEGGKNITHYITQRNDSKPPFTLKIPVEQPVYKFYIRHTISANVYIGDVWDAGTTWQEGLRNFIANSVASAK